METIREKRKNIQGFNVGPTINPCTKGLWIWREIFYSDSDTEK